jgi:ketosteroid isomerase-like protein
MTNQQPRARVLFEKQIDCIVRDDREAQMLLYADDLLYEFPFATDRPRRIEGKEAFLAVMAPLWQRNRQRGVKLVRWDAEVHDTPDPDFIVAEFTLTAEVEGRPVEVPFVQVFRTSGGKIAAVREYFSPVVRSQLSSEG